MVTMKTALVIGSTGLVGSHLVEQLISSDKYNKIILLLRKKTELYTHSKIEKIVFDFDHPDAAVVKADDVFCAIGTTIKKAGSQANQYKIDCEYPYGIAKIAKENGAAQFALVSSIGASAASTNFYLRTKGDLEEKLKSLNYNSLIIMRPSFILGDRKEFRLGEKVGILFAKLLSPLFIGGLKKYKGVNASNIAKSMILHSNNGNKGLKIVESDEI